MHGHPEHGAAPTLLEHFFVGAVIVIGLCALLWVQSEGARKARQERAAIEAKCRVPSEFETLVVFVNADAKGRLRVKCGPLTGGEGAYTRGKD